MHTVTRTLIATMAAVITVGHGAPAGSSMLEIPAGDPAPVAAPVTVIGATPGQRAAVHEALGVFEHQGLPLPPLVIEYADTTGSCDGHGGLYRPADPDDPAAIATVMICSRMRLILFHELAHAWDDHNLDEETRRRFLDHWGLARWNDRSDDWHHRGGEKAAHTVAYALTLEAPTDNPNILQFVCGYEPLTGKPPPFPDFMTCPEPSSAT